MTAAAKRKTKSAAAPRPAKGKPATAAPDTPRLTVGGGMLGATVEFLADAAATVPLGALNPNPHNPRSEISDDSVAELAASIEVDGLLQPLLVRAAEGAPPEYRIIAGMRRWRALRLLRARGLVDDGYAVPVRVVRAANDLDALRLAVVENLQREAVPPLDEAEAFDALIRAGESKERVAGLIGKTVRFVELRLALVTRLGDGAKTALRQGTLSLQAARILAQHDLKRQRAALSRLQQGYYRDAASLQRDLTDELPPAAAALFDLALYTGEFVEDAADPAVRWCKDVGQFEELQQVELDKRVAELKTKWAWVKVSPRKEYFRIWGFEKSRDASIAGAVIDIGRDWSIEVHEGLVKPEDAQKLKRKAAAESKAAGASKTGEKKPKREIGDDFTAALTTYCHNRRTEALQLAVAGDVEAAKTAVCAALLGGDGMAIAIRTSDIIPTEQFVLRAEVAEILKACKADLGKLVELQLSRERGADLPLQASLDREDGEAALIAAIGALKPAARDRLFAALVALRCLSHMGGRLDATGAAAALFELTKSKDWHHRTITADYLALCRMPRLVALAERLGVGERERLEKMRGKDLRAQILEAVASAAEKGRKVPVPPEMEFGSDEKAVKAWDKADKVPTAPAVTEKEA